MLKLLENSRLMEFIIKGSTNRVAGINEDKNCREINWKKLWTGCVMTTGGLKRIKEHY